MERIFKFYEFKDSGSSLNIGDTIKSLMAQLEDKCGHLSDLDKVFEQPLYKEIMGYGQKAIPYLLEGLKTGVFWFHGLRALTGAEPDKEHRGKMKLMKEDWAKWAEQNGYSKR